jgi:hypothetical protein
VAFAKKFSEIVSYFLFFAYFCITLFKGVIYEESFLVDIGYTVKSGIAVCNTGGFALFATSAELGR